MTLLFRWLLTLLLTLLGLLATLSTLVGTEQTWGLRHQPFPVLLFPLAELTFTCLLIWSAWRVQSRSVPFILLAWLGVAGLVAHFLHLLP